MINKKLNDEVVFLREKCRLYTPNSSDKKSEVRSEVVSAR